MSEMDVDPVVVDRPERHRYEIHVGDDLAGFVTYRRHPGRITFLHAETEEGFEGHGVGSTLVRHVLDEARAGGLSVVPACPFVAEYIDHHPEYQDLVHGV